MHNQIYNIYINKKLLEHQLPSNFLFPKFYLTIYNRVINNHIKDVQLLQLHIILTLEDL